jgi:transcriptional pleiotropic regulator of transition state genes
MKTTGMVRKIDELGRVVIPMELRRSLGIHPRDSILITLDEDRIILNKKREKCIFCGKEDKLKSYRDKFICQKCSNDLKKRL